jgi:hypothetical protein
VTTALLAMLHAGASHAALLAQDPAPTPGAAAAAASDTLPDEMLAASTEAPWIPDAPVGAASPLETALGLPGRVVSLPISGLGYLTKRSMVVVEDTQLVPSAMYLIAVLPQLGVAVSPASLGDRTGFGVKARLALPRLQDFLSAEWDGSTREYSSTRVRAGYGPVRLEYGYDWRPEDRFHGLGLETSDEDATSYAIQGQHVRLLLSHRHEIGGRPWRVEGAAWAGPRELITRSGRLGSDPSFETLFPGLGALLDRRVEHLILGARLAADGRSGKPHWSQGVRGAIEVQRFAEPVEALAFRTTHTDLPFTQWIYEAEGGISFYRDPRTLRLLVRAVDNRPDRSGIMLLGDLAGLGGSRGLAGFEPGRFHDLDAVVGRLSYIFPLAIRFEFDVHVEAGGVYGDLWSDPRLSSLEHSFGLALRPRLDEAVLGSVGVDWSREAVRLRFSIGGVE